MDRFILGLSLLAMFFVSCGQNDTESYTYKSPQAHNDAIEVGSLQKANIDVEQISAGIDSIINGTYKEVHSILVYKDDKLVLEEYFKGHRFQYDKPLHLGEVVDWNKDEPHRVMSVTKSYASTCVGIAVKLGFIEDIHQSIFDYLPDYQEFKTDGKENITIEHVLTMTSGLQWNEWALPYANPENDIIKLGWSEDPIAFYLNKPLVGDPGRSFYYSGGSTILLSKIVEYASDMKFDEFAEKYLFEPLGISSAMWHYYYSSSTDAAGGLEISARSMLKLGITFLNNGMWQDEQIVTSEWVEACSKFYPGNRWLNRGDDHWGLRGYSYQWWTHTFSHRGEKINMYYAAGWGGQFIMIFPQLDMVVVFTGGNYLTYRPAFEILKKYIMPALGVMVTPAQNDGKVNRKNAQY